MSVVKLMSNIIAPQDVDYKGAKTQDDVAVTLHDHTYGITSDPLTQFACIFSALVHDADHPGVPNSQLVKERTQEALVYENRSVAEQNSLDLSWSLLMDDRYTDLRNTICATHDEFDRFRQLTVNLVLATGRIYTPDWLWVDLSKRKN
uniref:PDEase domain-containing protein n=2 Tax=Amphora coffeiformis TaxID=265554 RepID=A0A7S3P462_9STRA|eukprot:scaffold2482_cov166-Amphora_coffeaeformis.AAC.24